MPPKMTGTRIGFGQTVADMLSGIGDMKAKRPADAAPAQPQDGSDGNPDLPAAGIAAINARKKPGGYNPGADADAIVNKQ